MQLGFKLAYEFISSTSALPHLLQAILVFEAVEAFQDYHVCAPLPRGAAFLLFLTLHASAHLCSVLSCSLVPGLWRTLGK